MLLHRYANIDYIMDLDIEDGIDFIQIAYQKDVEQKLWEQWLVNYANMDESNFMSFEDYKKKALSSGKDKNKPSLDAKSIIEDAEKIRKADQAEQAKKALQKGDGE